MAKKAAGRKGNLRKKAAHTVGKEMRKNVVEKAEAIVAGLPTWQLLMGMVVWIPIVMGINGFIHALNLLMGLGGWLDILMFYLDEVLIALLPIAFGKELLSRFFDWFLPPQIESDDD